MAGQHNRDHNSSSPSNIGSYASNKRRDNDKNCNSKSARVDRNFRCRECEGLGNYQVECSNFLKRKKNSLIITLSDDDSTIESDEEEDGKVLFGCTMEELNMIDVNLSSQQSNIDSIGDSVKQEVFNLSADHIYMK